MLGRPPPPSSPPPLGWVTAHRGDRCNQTPVITQTPALGCVCVSSVTPPSALRSPTVYPLRGWESRLRLRALPEIIVTKLMFEPKQPAGGWAETNMIFGGMECGPTQVTPSRYLEL